MAGASLSPSVLTAEVAAILRARAARMQLPHTALAQLIGISYPQVRRYLNAERVMDLEELDLMCEALEINIADVIREADEETESRHFDQPHLAAAKIVDDGGPDRPGEDPQEGA